MDKNESVTVLDSLESETEEEVPGEGEKPSEERPEINKASEKLRKENEALKAKMEEMQTGFEARIKELEKKPTLTQNQADELYQLRSKVDSIKSNPEARPWIELQREIAREEARKFREESLNETTEESLTTAMDWVDQKAKEAKVTPEQLQEELKEILKGGVWGDKLPHQRVKLAFSVRQKLLERFGKKETEKPEHSENPTKPVKTLSGSEAIKESIKSGSTKGLIAAIAARQSAESSEK